MAPLTDEEASRESRLCTRVPLTGQGYGVCVTLLADGTLYLSLPFGWLYLWTVSPNKTLPDVSAISPVLMGLSGALLTIAVTLYRRLNRYLRREQEKSLAKWLWLVSACGMGHVGLLAFITVSSDLQFTTNAYDAVLLVMLALFFHSITSVITTTLQALRVSYDYISTKPSYEIVVMSPMWLFTLVIFWLAVLLILPTIWEAK